MSRKIFVNMPVADLERSRAFFGKLGFKFNEQFSGGVEPAIEQVDHLRRYVELLFGVGAGHAKLLPDRGSK